MTTTEPMSAPTSPSGVSSADANPFAEWVVIELMGHRRLAGHLTEQEIAGKGFLRLDVPAVDGQPPATQLYNPTSVYCITPTTEEIARAVAAGNRPAPVHRWEFPALLAADGVDEGGEVAW